MDQPAGWPTDHSVLRPRLDNGNDPDRVRRTAHHAPLRSRRGAYESSVRAEPIVVKVSFDRLLGRLQRSGYFDVGRRAWAEPWRRR